MGALDIPTHARRLSGGTAPIWSHPNITLQPLLLSREETDGSVFIAHRVIALSRPPEADNLTRISAWVSTTPAGGDIVYMWSSFSYGKDPEDFPHLEHKLTRYFNVDGPGGERIVEIELTHSDGQISAITVCYPLLYLPIVGCS